jgi:PIN domain nuclease of toxin-antitoxin system
VRLLLDTHALFWWLIDEAQLSPNARDAVKSKDNEVYVSIASAWEMAIKVGVGKWPEAHGLLSDFEGLAHAEGFRLLPISVAHVRDAGLMRAPHRDPFDRLLAAQSMLEGLTIVTFDAGVLTLGGPCLW